MSNGIRFAAIVLAVAVAGCAPTLLRDATVVADPPVLNDVNDYGSLEMTSQGENLGLKLSWPDGGEACEGSFRLSELKKYYLVWGTRQLVYSGQWKSGLPTRCIEALGGPGGRDVQVIITEGDITGYRTVTLCGVADSDAAIATMGGTCFGERFYRVDDDQISYME